MTTSNNEPMGIKQPVKEKKTIVIEKLGHELNEKLSYLAERIEGIQKRVSSKKSDSLSDSKELLDPITVFDRMERVQKDNIHLSRRIAGAIEEIEEII
jgi:hypothetical protein